MNLMAFKMPDAMAKEVAKAADILKMPDNAAFGFHAVNLVLRSVLGTRQGRPFVYKTDRQGRRSRARKARR